MTSTLRQLRELFDDMSADAPVDHGRITRLEQRIRRDTRRRAVGAALAGVTALTAVGVFVPAFLLPDPAMKPRETTTAAVRPAPELPRHFTADDGTEYRRLATATLMAKSKSEHKTSITVPVSGKPLDVAAICPSNVNLAERPRIIVNGKPSGSWFRQCYEGAEMGLASVSVPKGASKVTITFDTTAWGCGNKEGEPCPSITHLRPANWSMAVYEWTPPARPVEPEPVKALPRRLGTMNVVGQDSGVWPRKSSFTLTVRSPGGVLGIEHLCTGDLVDRLYISYQIGDRAPYGGSPCRYRKEGLDPRSDPMVMTEIRVPKGEKITIRGNARMWGGHPNRQVAWSVGVYSR
ncbi:hypothetical protein [Nonomuraea jiangxiensis]|uniref:Uncharacterized protein n=1 Tax=Nonomuraea jiangxiensis TaxID=633440 RepID=A0A1G8Q2B1_9ACTN|nr:hypothetical protein [Nonomuraea jiangxiensis]SDI98857.1 hypothetical protein SAMN05421869_108109 [Nonomuraea jiangxiensis]